MVEVSCEPTGRCAASGTDHAVGDGAKFLFDLWLFSFTPGLALMALGARRSTKLRRAGRPTRGGIGMPLRLVIVWFVVLPVLALVLGIVSIVLQTFLLISCAGGSRTSAPPR
ncbi:hypothetical protein ACFV4P_22910 [Kitasatospora sp. NPDC059795]|uniref:hypothetical protein n=1 Tax=Kitasatospora sp. NPDC059795 TaxID=3346949 RepID=UPI003650134B